MTTAVDNMNLFSAANIREVEVHYMCAISEGLVDNGSHHFEAALMNATLYIMMCPALSTCLCSSHAYFTLTNTETISLKGRILACVF
jgi:hypothetical protein